MIINKTKRFALMALLTGILLPTGMQASAVFDAGLEDQKDRLEYQKLEAKKNRYVKDINLNAQAAYSYERLLIVGQKLKYIGIFTLIGAIPGTMLGDLLSNLGFLGYGPHLWATFIAVRNLESLAKKHPGILNEKDKRTLQTGKDVIKGPILRYIEKKLAVKKAIKAATQEFINKNIFFDKKRDAKLVSNYLERSIDVATYERLKRQRQETVEKIARSKGWGILSKVTSRAMKLINKLMDHPALKLSIKRKKKRITNFQNVLTSETRKALQQTAADLFKKVDAIKRRKFAGRIEELIVESETMEPENK